MKLQHVVIGIFICYLLKYQVDPQQYGSAALTALTGIGVFLQGVGMYVKENR